MKKQGGRCLCCGCKQNFTSVTAFDMHREGPHEKNGRYCLKTESEMVKAGLRKVFLGHKRVTFWTDSKQISQEKISLLRERAKKKVS